MFSGLEVKWPFASRARPFKASQTQFISHNGLFEIKRRPFGLERPPDIAVGNGNLQDSVNWLFDFMCINDVIVIFPYCRWPFYHVWPVLASSYKCEAPSTCRGQHSASTYVTTEHMELTRIELLYHTYNFTCDLYLQTGISEVHFYLSLLNVLHRYVYIFEKCHSVSLKPCIDKKWVGGSHQRWCTLILYIARNPPGLSCLWTPPFQFKSCLWVVLVPLTISDEWRIVTLRLNIFDMVSLLSVLQSLFYVIRGTIITGWSRS